MNKLKSTLGDYYALVLLGVSGLFAMLVYFTTIFLLLDLNAFHFSFKLLIILIPCLVAIPILRKSNHLIKKHIRNDKFKNEQLEAATKEFMYLNNKLTDSIKYAERIQKSILPSQDLIRQTFPKSFILYKAKDVVSGDFPWYFNDGNTAIIAAVDCTGHGVQGSMMSMIGYFLLKQIVEASFIHQPGSILDCLHLGVVTTLEQQENRDARDGMDVAICNISLDKMEVQFAGAHRSLYYVHNGKLDQIKGNSFPIGGTVHAKKGISVKFTNNILKVTPGDAIYFFSDGYPDQRGGPDGDKFMNKRIKELLVENQHLSMQEQRQILEKKFLEWKGTQDQLDDVIFIGIQF